MRVSRSRRKPLPQGGFTARVETFSHDGRGIARPEGKTTFLDNALPGEVVEFRYTAVHGKFDEGVAEQILEASPDRVEPPCEHALVCGGCSLQHYSSTAQLRHKQAVLAELFEHVGGVQPDTWLPPLAGATLGYRSKARLGARFVEPRQQALVGFREKRNNFLADLNVCRILVPEVGESLPALRALVGSLDARRRLPQVEVAAGEDALALVFRHMDPLGDADRQRLLAFCQARGWHCYLQPGNEQTVHRIWPEEGPERLHYRLPEFDLELAFHPSDFTQVNADVNRRMVPLALELLDVQPRHRVLDLFCGLGNFTLPLARRAGAVVGVELSEDMVQRGTDNARRNGLDNVRFHAWDLTRDVSGQDWAAQRFDRVLIDPPRAGALDMVRLMPHFGAPRLVYVSCNPSTLARDAGELKTLGYRLRTAGVMDMFPHTTHVESIALFERA